MSIPRTLALLCASLSLSLQGAEVVKQKVSILDLIKSGDVDYHINPKQDFHDDPKDIWTFTPDGQLKVSGRGYGYVATKKDYRDYHLVIEFKWGEKTWGARETKARDNGILLHGYGPHGAYGGTWMASIEAQIIEGGTGDILVLSPKLEDGTELTTSLTCEYTLDRDKEKIWKKGEPKQVVTKGRINWKGRDEDWADMKGFRGKNDVESPPGEWNRLEVIAKGDTLQYFLNGAFVNEGFEAKPSQGKILLQTEGAEMIVRRYELWPLGEFKEKWSAIQASGGSDIGAVREGQDKALAPEESLKRIQLDGPYEAQLAAAEPLVLDPVEITWDENGRMFVADMRDYPLGPPNPNDPWLSRIVQLVDENGDGRMDKSIVFADNVDHVQGLLPHDGGLIATTRTQILFLKDTDGDGKADVTKPLIKGFNPRHSQLQVSAPRWGPDGCVHFNNGLDTKEIYPADDPKSPVNVPGSNFKWNPRTGKITPTGGKGQYGGAFDDWGHHFYCSNRNPLMFTVMPWEAMSRNPHAGITQNYEDIATPGADTRVYPLQITHTTADAHAGTNTACSGLGVYRGHLMPELRNNVFVPEPTGQLVTRYKIEPNGASLKATRVGDRTEFFRSSDEWCRPVNFTTGPDGAIYICDIYRRWIDHARFFPEEFVKANDMRQGEHHGRIWRVVPKGKTAPKIEAAPKEVEKLVAWLGDENAWQRETALRVLRETNASAGEAFWRAAKNQKSSLPLGFAVFSLGVAVERTNEGQQSGIPEKNNFTQLRDSVGRREFSSLARDPVFSVLLYKYLMTFDGPPDLETASQKTSGEAVLFQILNAGSYPRPAFVEIIKAGLTNFPDDPWIHRAVLSAYPRMEGAMYGATLKWFVEGQAGAQYSAGKSSFIRQLSLCLGASAGTDEATKEQLRRGLEALSIMGNRLLWWKPALLQGLAEGLPKSGGKLGVKTLAEFVAKPPQGFEAAAQEIGVLLAKVDDIIADPKAPLDQRLAVLPLLASRKWAAVEPVLKGLLTTAQPGELTAAAVALLKKFSATSTSPLIYELLPKAGPALKRDLVPILTANATTALAFFKRMEKGEFPTAWVDVETRWRYQRGSGEMTELAKKLFGEASSDRAAVVKDYMAATKHAGDATKGQQVFATICITCHKHGSMGVDVGPPLSDVKVKPPEGLLSDILDPNRMFEARWTAYQVDTKDGRTLSGLIQSETADNVVLAMMGGLKETIQRSAIKEMKCLDRSLMPPGLEATITKEQMSDLLAFLRSTGAAR